MKKITLIIISVIVLFTACGNQTDNSDEESFKKQIDLAENFDGITFGMTKEEIIELYGRQPDQISEISGIIQYSIVPYFTIRNAYVMYGFDDNGKLNYIDIWYFYIEDTEDNLIQAAYDSIKEKLLRRYSEAGYRVSETDNTIDFSGYDRSIYLSMFHTDFLRLEIIYKKSPIDQYCYID